jgi:hypothetical protein
LLSSNRKLSNSQKTSAISSSLSNVHNYALKTERVSSSANSAILTTAKPKIKIDHSIITANKDKVYLWILDQSKEFKHKYFNKLVESDKLDKTDSKKSGQKRETKLVKNNNDGLDVLEKIKASVLELDMVKNSSDAKVNDTFLKSLKKINNILHETDISSFEMIHSGLIEKLLSLLKVDNEASNNQSKFQSSNFIPSSSTKINPSYFVDLNRLVTDEFKVLKLKQFLNVFLNLPLTYYTEETNSNLQKAKSNFTCTYFSLFVSKLHNCVNQLEQYAVRVHDVPNSIGNGKAAIKFFNTHQIKCLLQRYPSTENEAKSTTESSLSTSNSSSNLRQWKSGNVKIDPLAYVGTIEKYLLVRGIHKPVNANINCNFEF